MLIKKDPYNLQYHETDKHPESHVIASRSRHLVVVFCENHVTEISKGLLKFLTNPLKNIS